MARTAECVALIHHAQAWVKPLGLTNVRLTVSGENLTYWSKRKGLDPRINYGGSITNTKYAPSRTITGSLSIQF